MIQKKFSFCRSEHYIYEQFKKLMKAKLPAQLSAYTIWTDHRHMASINHKGATCVFFFTREDSTILNISIDMIPPASDLISEEKLFGLVETLIKRI